MPRRFERTPSAAAVLKFKHQAIVIAAWAASHLSLPPENPAAQIMTLISHCAGRSYGRRFVAKLSPLVIYGVAIVAATPSVAQLPKSNDPLDWPNWRGPQQISASLERGLPDTWDPKGGEGSNLVKKFSYLGTRSTPIVMNGKLYVLCRDKPGTEHEGEKVVCADAVTGEQLWQHRFNVYLTDTPDTRVAWSCVVGDPTTGRVYAQGVCGYFCCLEGDGKLVWEHSLAEEYGFITTYGGRTTMPVVFEDQVLVNCVEVGWGDTPPFDNLARPAHRFLSFDKATGEIRWLSSTNISPPDTTYSTPTITVIDGEAQLIFGAADGQVWSIQPRTGKALWHYPLSMHGLNVSPLVVGDMVYMTHGWENMVGTTKGGIVAIDAKQRGDLTGKEKWFNYHVLASKSSPVWVDGQIWVVDDTAKLFRFDPETGSQIGNRLALGSRMAGSPLVADGKVYIATESGIVYILKPDGENLKKPRDFVRLNREEINGSPIASHGRIYLPTSDAIYCIGLPDVEPSADPAPEMPAEISVGKDPDPAWVQIVPYDLLLKPGESHKFTVRLFNSHGQLVRAATNEECAFRVEGPGEIAADGTYTAPGNVGHVGTLVYCKVGEIEGKARVRIVPPLPWTFNFNEGEIPISWIGGRVRYVLKEIDGDRAAFKLDVLPTPRDPNNKLGTRSAMYMGAADMTNYTVQADVRLAENDGRPPDVVGIINSGYTLGIRPGGKSLSIYSWASHDYRTQKAIDFDPKIGAWYRLKLRVDQQDGKALVRGKYWLRDQAEPDGWSLEMTDDQPQKSGSPGVFGNAQTAPFYLDNLSVVAND
jgi:outer membrane protein assembly factor BamB